MDAIGQIGLTGIPVGEVIPMDVMMSASGPDREPGRAGLPLEKPKQSDYTKDDPFPELETTAFGTRTLYHHESIFDDIVGLAQDWRPDLVLRDPFMWAAASRPARPARWTPACCGAPTPSGRSGPPASAPGAGRRNSCTGARAGPTRCATGCTVARRYGFSFDEGSCSASTR